MNVHTHARGPIVFYDGECGLCAKLVQWCLAHDHDGVLRFAPLQGVTYAALADPDKPRALETLALLDAGGLHVRSTAALRILRHIGGIWAVLGNAGRLIPRPLRDWAYDFVAGRRIAWFGTADACKLPAQDTHMRFLA